MKKLAAVLFLLFCIAPLVHGEKTRYGQRPTPSSNPADYTIKVHISGIHFRILYAGDRAYDYEVIADATVNGQNIELTGDLRSFHHDRQIRVLPGDYLAHFVKNEPRIGDTLLLQGYDLLMPDKTVWQSSVTGISE
jgi:hypothetical protein